MLVRLDARRLLMVGLVMATATALAADYGGSGSGRVGRPEADCLVGLAGAPSGGTIDCTDADPACDADEMGAPNGSCTFRLQICVNLPGIAGCAPTALRSVSAKPRALFPTGAVPAAPADATSACGAFTDVVVRTRKGGSRPGRRKIRLAARSLGKPTQADKDVFRLVCRPSAGRAGGSTTTTIPRPSTCTIDMDVSCPDTTAVCGATFAGGSGCFVEGKPGCYDSGTKSYKVAAGQTLTVNLSRPIVGLDVFFAAEGSATGTMAFRDEMRTAVGAPLTTNGDCLAAMPPRQQMTFTIPVQTIDVTASGGVVWVDSLTLAQ